MATNIVIHMEFFKDINQNSSLESPTSNQYSDQNTYLMTTEFFKNSDQDSGIAVRYEITTELSQDFYELQSEFQFN